jgi:hypothetical protein
MLVFRFAALLIALSMISAPSTAVGQAQSQPAAIAPEHQEMAAKRAKEREKINNCQKQATEQKILPRDRPQFVINCLDGRTKSAFRRRAGVSGIGGKKSEGKGKGRQLPETGHRTKSPAPRSAAIRDQLPGPIAQPT